jgi:hypothetical protein
MKGQPMRFAGMLLIIGLVMLVAGSGFAQDTTKKAPQGPAVTYEDNSLKLTKEASVRIGALLQPALTFQQDLPSASQAADANYNRRWQRQMFVRRMRLLFDGKVTPNFTFFFDLEAPNVGFVTTSNSTPKANAVAPALLDAQIGYIASQEFSVMTGLILLGITRNGLTSAAALMPVNYGSYTFTSNSGTGNALDNGTGRDVALMARGLLADNRLEYRVSLSDGRSRNGGQALYSPFRVTARLAYDVFDVTTPDLFAGIHNFYYAGSSFGKKQSLSIGGGIDMQGGFMAFGGDVFLDYPTGGGDGLTVSLGVQHIDGGSPDQSFLVPRRVPATTDSLPSGFASYFTPKQTDIFVEAGYYIADLKLQPVVKFESKAVSTTDDYQLKQQPPLTQAETDAHSAKYTYWSDLASESRIGFGLNYLPKGNNFNIKSMWEIVMPIQSDLPANGALSEFKKSYSMFTLQAQWFFF